MGQFGQFALRRGAGAVAAGHAITSHDIFLTMVSIVIGLVFWTALHFSRKRIVVLKRPSGTDHVAFELSRIADALERIANHPADRVIAAATRRQLAQSGPRERRRALPIPSWSASGMIFAYFSKAPIPPALRSLSPASSAMTSRGTL